jgi:bifunctional non-homologous end joining protein LigD
MQFGLTIHRWLSKYTAPTSPDIMVIDIDPPKGKFHVACKGAIFLREKANELGYKAFVMLTGAKGLHIVFPIIKKISFEDIRAILGNIILDCQYALKIDPLCALKIDPPTAKYSVLFLTSFYVDKLHI